MVWLYGYLYAGPRVLEYARRTPDFRCEVEGRVLPLEAFTPGTELYQATFYPEKVDIHQLLRTTLSILQQMHLHVESYGVDNALAYVEDDSDKSRGILYFHRCGFKTQEEAERKRQEDLKRGAEIAERYELIRECLGYPAGTAPQWYQECDWSRQAKQAPFPSHSHGVQQQKKKRRHKKKRVQPSSATDAGASTVSRLNVCTSRVVIMIEH